MEETLQDLLADLNLDAASDALKTITAAESKYIRDLRMNLKGIYKSKALNQKEVALIALAIATNNKNENLTHTYTEHAKSYEATDAEIAEAMACASLLSANNVLYRFKHFVGKESYENMRAGIRMNIMMTPVLGKELFELISIAVSAVNGCEQCIKSHEVSVLEAGGSEARIWDAVRIASVVTSADRLV